MRERPIFTFHYVSIKTYDRCRPAHQNSYLHSTMYLLKPAVRITQSQSLTFTFHYVSIKTRSAPAAYSEPYVFTFHYVSIKTLWHIHIDASSLNLHSTMYLLKLPDEPDELLSSVFTFHYVSIKTRTPAAQQHRHNKFTFHYVSIKTKCILFFHRCFLYLHSTMYLLKHTKQSAAIDKNKEIYIPLCIY